MRTYVRAEGEAEIFRELVEGVRDHKRMHGFVVLTDRRVVALVAKKVRSPSWLLDGMATSWSLDGVLSRLIRLIRLTLRSR